MKNKKIMPLMSFKQAVEATPDVATGYNTGLTALGAYKSKISVSDTRLLQGSIDIDDCTREKYPEENRWDYAFAYNDEVIFIEVHTANTREVRAVLKKLQWLKDWLNQQAPEINKLKTKKRPPFYWIQSKGFAIPKTSPQYRLVETSGLKPISILRLP
jgi:hypothetical protein